MTEVKTDSGSIIEKGVGSSGSLSESAETPVTTYPEGGLQGWLAVAGAFLVQLCTFGYTQSFGVYQDYYVRSYLNNYTSSDISWIGAIQVFLVLSTGLITGYAFDRGYFYYINTGGCVLLVFCLFMLSLSHEHSYYQVFLSHGLGAGLGVGLTYVPSVAVLAHYFQKRRALVMGIASSGSCIGGIIHPIMLNHFFNNPSIGFHKGVRISAGMNTGILFIGCALMRTRLPPKEGLGARAIIKSGIQFMKDPAYIFTCIGAFLVVLGSFFPIFFLQLDAITRGLDPNFAFDTLAILYSASYFGRIIPNYLAHRFGIFNVMNVSLVCLMAILYGMIGVTTVGSTIVFSIIFGFFAGAFVSLISPLLASLAQDVNEVGARMGICHTFNGVAGFIGVPIGAALLTSRNLWTRPIGFSSACVTVGVMFFVAARLFVVRRKGTQFV